MRTQWKFGHHGSLDTDIGLEDLEHKREEPGKTEVFVGWIRSFEMAGSATERIGFERIFN